MKTGLILIRGARQLLTLRGPRGPRSGAAFGEIGVINDGCVLIRDGTIIEVGTSRRVENLAAARSAVEINASGRVVMPGFVDSHTHLIFPLGGGPAGDTECAARAVRQTTGQRIQWRTEPYVAAMARHGTTTVEAKTGCGPDESAEIKLLRVLAAFKDAPLHIVPTFLFRLPAPEASSEAAMAEAASHICREVLPKFHRRRFARFADLVWDRSPACHHLYTQYLDAASRLRMPCKIHADQPGAAEAVAAAVHHLATSVDHLEGASRSDAALLAGTATMATLLPMASFRKSVVPPTRALIEAGVALAIASNFNPQHTPTLNMQTVIGFACIHLGMTPEQAITAATINGAHAIRRADKVGSLEVGKSADLLMLNLSDYRELGQHSGTNAVHMTMKGGECIYKEGEVMPRPAEEITSGLLTD